MAQFTLFAGKLKMLFSRALPICLLLASCATPESMSPTETQNPILIVSSSETTSSVSCPTQQAANASVKEGFVGLQIPPHPDGYDSISGVLIDNNYILSHVRIGKQEFLWLAVIQCKDEASKSHSQIVDAVTLPTRQEGEFVYTASCSYEGVADSSIVAFGYIAESNSSLLIAMQAWRANIAEKRFQQLPAEKVSCIKDCVEC